MRIIPDKCPECGADVKGTIEIVQGLAGVFRTEDGAYEHGGETEIFWDSIETMTDPATDKAIVQCENDHEFQAEIKED